MFLPEDNTGSLSLPKYLPDPRSGHPDLPDYDDMLADAHAQSRDRVILHCDMNAYYASVEIMMNPALRGKPVAVCGSPENRHGIVLAKSQEAKQFKVQTGEVIWQARQKCPDLILVPPHYDQYLKYSRLARAIYYSYTDQVEPFGLDECWLDVTGSLRLFETGGKELADTLRRRIHDELGLTISVGVSFNKIFAKLGSDLKKPDATTVIAYDNYREIIRDLPVRSLLGVGSATERKLRAYNIETIGDLAATEPYFLQRKLGVNGYRLWRWANGWDDARVSVFGAKAPVKSVGNGVTARRDLLNNADVFPIILHLAYEVSSRLRAQGLRAAAVQISVRDNLLYSREYRTSLPYPTESATYIARYAFALFVERYDWRYPIRALTVRAIHLSPVEQMRQQTMFDDFETLWRWENLETAIFRLRERFGPDMVKPAVLMGDLPLPNDIPYEIHPPGCFQHMGY